MNPALEIINQYRQELQAVINGYGYDEPVTAENIELISADIEREHGRAARGEFALDILYFIGLDDLESAYTGESEEPRKRTKGEKAETAINVISSIFGAAGGLFGAIKSGKNQGSSSGSNSGLQTASFRQPGSSQSNNKNLMYVGIAVAAIAVLALAFVAMKKGK
jgi:hypothetical protein